MQRYRNMSGNAGVIAYELRPDGIVIKFADGGTYFYNDVRPGKRHVERMKALAKQGSGLTTFINQKVRGNYAAKLR